MQVWNQSRPPWLNAILKPLKNMMPPIIELLLEATKVSCGCAIIIIFVNFVFREFSCLLEDSSLVNLLMEKFEFSDRS